MITRIMEDGLACLLYELVEQEKQGAIGFQSIDIAIGAATEWTVRRCIRTLF